MIETRNIYTTEYAIGDIVYLKTDPDKQARLITGLQINPGGEVYRLSIGDKENWAYAMEFGYDKNYLNY